MQRRVMTFFFPYTSSLQDLTDIETTAFGGLFLLFFSLSHSFSGLVFLYDERLDFWKVPTRSQPRL